MTTSSLPHKGFAVLFGVAALVVAAAVSARGQTTYTWDGGGGDNLWSTNANWVGDAAPSRNATTFLTFAGSTRTSPFNNASDWARLAGITFASGASGFRVEGNAIGFVNDNGDQVINQDSAATQEINATFSFGSSRNSQINLNAGDLLISSANMFIDVTSSAARQVFIGGSDSTRRTVTLATTVNNSGSGQNGDLVINNNKRVLVTGTLNNGTGTDWSVFVNDGVLQFSGAGAMTGGSPLIGAESGAANAALWLDTAGTTFARQVEFRSGSSGRRTIGGLNTSGTVTFSGNFVGSAGNFDVAAATGGVAVFSGVRNFNAGLFVNRPDGATNYGGTVILSGTTNSTNFTALEAGTLQFSDFNQIGSGHFEFNATAGDSGTLRYTGGSTTTTKTLWIDNPGITRAAIDVSQAGTTLTWEAGGTQNTNLTKTGAGSLFFKNGISGGTVGIEGGMLVLTASNSYSGGTTVTAGTIEVSAGGSLGGSAAGLGTGPVSIGPGGQVTYWLSQSAGNTISNAFSLSGGTLFTQDGANTYSGLVTLASGTSTIAAKYEDYVTLSGGLAGSGNVLFTQTGGTGNWAAPTFLLSGTGSNTGTVRVSGSSGGGATKLLLNSVNALQGATLDMAAGDTGTVEFGNGSREIGGLMGSRDISPSVAFLNVGGNGASTEYSGRITMNASYHFTKTGTGTLLLSGSNGSLAGEVRVTGGRLEIGPTGSINASSAVSVSNGAEFKYNSATPFTTALSVGQGTLSGTGTIAAQVFLSSTATVLSPGNSPGILTFGTSQAWSAYTYVWELNDYTTGTTAGVNFDQVAIAGSLNLAGNNYVLDITSLTAGNLPGDVGNFSDVQRSWTILTTTGGITGFDASEWTLLTNDFTTSAPLTGTWSLAQVGNDLVLTAVPEPSTLALAATTALAAGGWGFLRRRTDRRFPAARRSGSRVNRLV